MILDLVFKNHTSPRSRSSSGLRQKNSRTSLRGRQKAPNEKFFRDVFEFAIDYLKISDKKIELGLQLVSEDKIRELNNRYRHKDKPTDVLSFPLGSKMLTNYGILSLGDIFICLPIAKKEAITDKMTFQAKLAQLTVHGFLHLLGYDHEISRKDAEKMLKLENRILSKLQAK